jgi:hypothetical protein
MTKRYTTVAGECVNVNTEEIASVHDRGVLNGLPVLKLVRGDGLPHVFVFGTELGFRTNIEDMTVTL